MINEKKSKNLRLIISRPNDDHAEQQYQLDFGYLHLVRGRMHGTIVKAWKFGKLKTFEKTLPVVILSRPWKRQHGGAYHFASHDPGSNRSVLKMQVNELVEQYHDGLHSRKWFQVYSMKILSFNLSNRKKAYLDSNWTDKSFVNVFLLDPVFLLQAIRIGTGFDPGADICLEN